MHIKKEEFGKINNIVIDEYTLTNSNNLSLSVITYGAIITKIMMPDRDGKIEEITVNFETLDEMVKSRPFHGAIIGPVAGRISKGRYFEGDNEIRLDQNEDQNTLHSGQSGLDTKIWEVETREEADAISLVMTTELADGEAGFPGNVKVTVMYTLNETNELTISYEATTDKPTLFNPTNHVYFNLSGNYENTIDDHEIQVDSDYYAELDSENIPTGKLKLVFGTDFDLRTGEMLKKVLASEDEQIASRNGLDHPFVLNKIDIAPAVRIHHEGSGRTLEMRTDSDAVVIYTHNQAQEPLLEKDRTLPMHSGLTIETTILPDAVNQEDFGSIWLKPEEPFEATTTFTFSN